MLRAEGSSDQVHEHMPWTTHGDHPVSLWYLMLVAAGTRARPRKEHIVAVVDVEATAPSVGGMAKAGSAHGADS